MYWNSNWCPRRAAHGCDSACVGEVIAFPASDDAGCSCLIRALPTEAGAAHRLHLPGRREAASHRDLRRYRLQQPLAQRHSRRQLSRRQRRSISPSAASAIDRGAGTCSKRTLPAGAIQVITSTASLPARTAGSSSLNRRAVSGSHVQIEMLRRRSSSWSTSGPPARRTPRSRRSARKARCRLWSSSASSSVSYRCIGPKHEHRERVPVELHASSQTRLSAHRLLHERADLLPRRRRSTSSARRRSATWRLRRGSPRR